MPPKKKKKKKAQEEVVLVKAAEGAAEEDEGLPPWMATFADMVTLLLCFFVLLLSFTNQDIQNFDEMKGSIQESFGVQTQDMSAMKAAYSTAPFESGEASRMEIRKMAEMAQVLRAYTETENISKQVNVHTDQDGIMVRVASAYLFRPGTADIRPEGVPLLRELIERLKQNPQFDLFIRGHTDDTEKAGSKYENSRWVLSAARASACIRFILEQSDISPRRLIAVGYGDTNPLAPNTSEENRAINRRVEFFYKLTDRPDRIAKEAGDLKPGEIKEGEPVKAIINSNRRRKPSSGQ